VVLTTEDEVDISRGDMLVRKKNVPSMDDRFEAYLCWMNETPMVPGVSYLVLPPPGDVQAASAAI
jgi:bifunctional enzyme CysN/CysC